MSTNEVGRAAPNRRASRPGDGLRWLHLLAGLAGLAAFLVTGQFMDRQLDHLAGMPAGPRALYRSAHIYILLASLLHLVLGTYAATVRYSGLRLVQYLGSALLLAALVLFLYGFFVETPRATVERPMIRRAILWSFWGVLLHLGASLLALPAVRQAIGLEAGAGK